MRSDRLLELAAHLKSDRRGHKFFDFTLFSAGQRDPKRHECGTAGCAFGELPVVWPEAWEFGQARGAFNSNLYSVRLKSHQRIFADSISARKGACEWFDLSENEIHALFYANRELLVDSPIKSLDATATAEEVADRFIAFVKWREEQADEGGA
ncbi:hypothetical protein LCGC14_0734800 [marine sediment metagenome]|uniref:Uncharacterized protein n=1 Tax=marine sediment metagenome TaxID=412755 RepID=A0A0F9TFW1_9ZZZZ